MTSILCPDCGSQVRRSHARRFNEKLVRALTRYRVYRCHHCGWRGWLSKGQPPAKRHRLRTTISLLITLCLTLLAALYMAGAFTSAAPPSRADQYFK